MKHKTVSSRDFTRDVSAAKRATAAGPVFITDRGRPAFALLSIEDYYRLAGRPEASLLEVMRSLPASEGVAFEPPRAQVDIQSTSLEFDEP